MSRHSETKPNFLPKTSSKIKLYECFDVQIVKLTGKFQINSQTTNMFGFSQVLFTLPNGFTFMLPFFQNNLHDKPKATKSNTTIKFRNENPKTTLRNYH